MNGSYVTYRDNFYKISQKLKATSNFIEGNFANSGLVFNKFKVIAKPGVIAECS